MNTRIAGTIDINDTICWIYLIRSPHVKRSVWEF